MGMTTRITKTWFDGEKIVTQEIPEADFYKARMTKEEALKLALEALENELAVDMSNYAEIGAAAEQMYDAINAIKEALAQPDAFEQGRQEGMKQERALWELTKLGQEIEAQPAQRPWVGLTLDEVMTIGRQLGLKCRLGGNANIDFDYAEAIEAKLKEKNT